MSSERGARKDHRAKPHRSAQPRSHASSTRLLPGHRLKQRIELLDHRRAEMTLRVRRRHTVHHFPAANEDARVIERAPEIRSRLQALLEQGIAEIGPVAAGGAAE